MNTIKAIGLVKILLRRAKDVCPGFESQGGLPALHVLAPASDGFLSFTSSATPANLLVANVAAEPLYPLIFSSIGRARSCAVIATAW